LQPPYYGIVTVFVAPGCIDGHQLLMSMMGVGGAGARALRVLRVLLVAGVLCFASARTAGGAPAAEGGDGDVDALFASNDADGDGALSLEEYGRMFSVLEADADAGAGAHGEPSQEWEGFFRRADTSGDGRLSHAEWTSALFHSLGRDNTPPACSAAAANSVGAVEGGAGAAGGPSAQADTGPTGSAGAGHGNANNGDVKEFAMAFDANRDGALDLEEFRELMSGEGLDGGEDDEEIDEVAEVFAKWDFDADKSLNAGELKHGLNLAAGIVPDIPEEFYNVKRPDEYGRVIDPETMKTLTDDEASATDLGANPDELFALVRAGDEKEVALWLQRHKLPDGGVNDGTCSPLHVSLERFDKAVQHLHLGAIQGNYSAVALVLIDKGADLRHEYEGISPLIRAVFARCLPVVRRILGLYADKVAARQIPKYDITVHFKGERNDLSPGGGTALHAAAYLHPVAIGVSKILTAHPGSGPANHPDA
jgi:hypothetical protein